MNKLSDELIGLILIKLVDNNSIKNARLVCRNWYNYLKPLKRFKENTLFETVHFYDNYIAILYPNNSLKSEYLLPKDILDTYVFNEYNNRGILINTIKSVPPYSIIQKEIKYNTIETTEYDISKNKSKKTVSSLLFYPQQPCIIS